MFMLLCESEMQSTHCRINDSALEILANTMVDGNSSVVVTWDACNWHYCDDVPYGGPLACQYIFVLDALNFCFWPQPGLEYDTLAISLKEQLEKDKHSFDGDRLMKLEMVTNDTTCICCA